jgi:ribosome-associated protein
MDTEDSSRSLTLAVLLAQALDRKKGDRIEILDLRKITVITDFFIFVSGFARIQIQALADTALDEAHQANLRCRSIEGYGDSGWILLDFGDVIVHLMTEESRDYYRLDHLWGDAPRVKWE